MKVIATDLLNKNGAEHFAIFFTDDGIVVDCQTSSPLVHFTETVKQLDLVVNAAYLDNSILVIKCHTPCTSEQVLKNGFHIHNAKTFLASTDEEKVQRVILRAVHWLTWDEKLQYCSQCGGGIQKVFDAAEKKCSVCNLSFFPKLSPAVMVLIQRENEILLARSAHFKPGFYSVIAGFIDIGETAELAVHREVKEEVGLYPS